MPKMNLALVASDVNHLRRLLAYIDLELGQEPEAMATTIRSIVHCAQADAEGVKRLADAYDRSVAVPLYVRAAIKALKARLVKGDGEIVDVDSVRTASQITEK